MGREGCRNFEKQGLSERKKTVKHIFIVTFLLDQKCKSWPYLINTEWHKKRELLKNPTKIEEIQEKKFINRNW